MRRFEKNELLRDVLGGHELRQARDVTLVCGLEVLRGRKYRRRYLQGTVIVALVSLLVLLAHWHRTDAVRRQVAVSPIPKASAKADGVEFITKKELFALFPNRPVAIIGGPGHREFVLLDEMGRNGSVKGD